MPSDFYGGVGVDLLYPSSLGMNAFSEPEWSSSHIVCLLAAGFQALQPSASSSSLPYIALTPQQAPLPASEYAADAYPTPASSRPPPLEVSALPHHMTNIPRPKSSPSTFGPNVEDLLFTENPFKFRTEDFRDYPSFSFPSPVPSGKSSPFFGQDQYSASARTSPARHAPVPIAPDPVGLRQLQSMKRMREDDDAEQAGQQRKRKRAVSSTGPVELNEEETLLLKLKEEENLPWKDIATRFQTDLGKTYQVPALQMRFKRLRERMRAWSETERSKRVIVHQGKNAANGALTHQRCSSSVPPSLGQPSNVHANGRSYTPNPYHQQQAQQQYHRGTSPLPHPPQHANTMPTYPTTSLYPTANTHYQTVSPTNTPTRLQS